MEFPLPIFDKSSKPTSIAQAPSDNMSLLPGPWLGLYGNFPRPKPKRRRKGDPLPTSVSSTTSICSKYPKKRTDRPACVNTIDEDDDDVFSSAEDLFTSALDVPTTNSSPSSGKNFSSLASTDQLDRFEALGKSPLAPSKSSKNESTPTPSSSRQGPWLGLAVPVPTLDQLSQHWSKSADRTESSQPEEMHPVNNVPRSISNPFTESTLSNDTLFSAESLNSKVEFQPSARSYSNDNIDVVKRLLALQRQKKMDFSTDSTMMISKNQRLPPSGALYSSFQDTPGARTKVAFSAGYIAPHDTKESKAEQRWRDHADKPLELNGKELRRWMKTLSTDDRIHYTEVRRRMKNRAYATIKRNKNMARLKELECMVNQLVSMIGALEEENSLWKSRYIRLETLAKNAGLISQG